MFVRTSAIASKKRSNKKSKDHPISGTSLKRLKQKYFHKNAKYFLSNLSIMLKNNCISANSFRRNCSFLSLWIVENFNFLLNKMNFCCGNYSKPETMYTGKYGILKNLYSAHKASDLYKMIYLWNHLNVRIFTLPSIANYVCILNISTKFLLWKALGTGATIHGFASLAFSTTFWLISVISHLSPKDRFEKMGYKWSCGSTRSLQNR